MQHCAYIQSADCNLTKLHVFFFSCRISDATPMSARLHLTAHYGPDSGRVITGFLEARFDHRVIVDNHEHLDYRLAMRWGGGGENAQHVNIIALAFYPVEGGMYVMSAWFWQQQRGEIRMCTDAVMYSLRRSDALPCNVWPLNPQFLNDDVQLRFTGPAVDRIVDYIGSLSWNTRRDASGYVMLSNTDPQFVMLHNVRPLSRQQYIVSEEDSPSWGDSSEEEFRDRYFSEQEYSDREEYSDRDFLEQEYSEYSSEDDRREAEDEFLSDDDEAERLNDEFLREFFINLLDLDDRAAAEPRHWAPAAAGPRHAWQALEGQDPSDVSTLYANATDEDRKKFDDWECKICYRKMQHNAEGDAEELASIEHNENELVSVHPPVSETPDLHHVFHRHCLEEWYRNIRPWQSRTCPACRHDTRELSHEPLPAVWSPGNTKLAARMETKLLTTHAARNPYITSM